MTPERLKTIERIYHDVLEVLPKDREKFLSDSCGDDTELRTEIESLLSFENIEDDVIDAPPKTLINEIFSNQITTNLINKQVSQYKILSLLGEGGMGAVFLAHDTKLERKVAIKFLSDKFLLETNSLNRFFLEAKSSSALNHPNIITIHEIGEYEGRPFIANEFIDGITLKDFLSERKASLSELVEILIQIASALSSAHKAGIIHRDIKPENIMIRKDGIVKILDFGLAKLNQNSNEADTVVKDVVNFSTIHGIVLGTPQFMSPEQVRGKKVDVRTDIWSFGVLIYQMLTQRLPFQGETTNDVIASILKTEPLPLTDYVPNIPIALQEITLKSLKKTRSERFQTIDEVLSELKNFRRNYELGTKTEPYNLHISNQLDFEKNTDAELVQITAKDSNVYSGKISVLFSQTVTKARQFPVFTSLIFVAFISLIGVLGLALSKATVSINQLSAYQKMKLSKLTFDGTTTNKTAISPDGKYIVYVLREESKETLMLRQITTSSAVQIVPASTVNYTGLTFSSDGNYIFYTVFENNIGNLYEIPVLGGTPRKILEKVDGKVTFSPDSKMMAFVRNRTSVMISDVKGDSPQLLATAASGTIWRQLDWSPDGEKIIGVSVSNDNFEHLTEVLLKDGSQKILSDTKWNVINGLSWLADGSGILITGREPETKFSQVWRISYPEGKPERITNDFSTYVDLSITDDNKSVVTIKQEKLYNIWVSPNENAESAKKITVEEGKDEGFSGIYWTPDGKIVYTVRTSNTIDIWIVNADGSNKRQLTINQGSNYSPVVSSDGKYIVFTSDRSKNLDVWRMNIDGTNQVQLTLEQGEKGNPYISPDGKSVLYQKLDANGLSTIWKVDIEGGEPVKLTDIKSSRPVVSPDGKSFACFYGKAEAGNNVKIAIIPIDGGEPTKLLDLPLILKSNIFRWSDDGKSIVYVDNINRASNLWSQRLDNSPPKQLTFFESGKIARFSFTPDGKQVAFSRGNESADVVQINDFR